MCLSLMRRNERSIGRKSQQLELEADNMLYNSVGSCLLVVGLVMNARRLSNIERSSFIFRYSSVQNLD
jgi:hypothetical protein